METGNVIFPLVRLRFDSTFHVEFVARRVDLKFGANRYLHACMPNMAG